MCLASDHYDESEYIRDYGELKSIVDALINDYKEYLSSEQMIYLEAIRGNRLNQFFRTDGKADSHSGKRARF